MTEVTNGQNTVVVQIHKRYRGHAQQIAAALWGTGGSVWFHKNDTNEYGTGQWTSVLIDADDERRELLTLERLSKRMPEV